MKLHDQFYVDNTILKAVATCSTKAVLRHVLHRTSSEERAILLSGTAGHEALATYLRNVREYGSGAIAMAMDTLRDQYHAWALDNVPNDDRLGWDNVSSVVAEWLESRHGHLPFVIENPDDIEIGFAHPLDDHGDVVFFGRMDGTATYRPTAEFVVLEHKFTGRITPDWVRGWMLDPQVTGYLWAAQQTHPNITGLLINAVELSKLPTDPSRKCREHNLPYRDCGRQHLKAQIIGPINRTAAQIAEWRKTALMLAERYRDLHAYSKPIWLDRVRMQGMFTMGCRFCEFNEFCRLGRPIAQLPVMTVEQPWRPYTPTTEAE